MKRSLLAALIAALMLAGCSPRTEPIPETILPEEVPAVEESTVVEEETVETPTPVDSFTQEGNTVTISLAEEQSFDFILLQGISGAGTLTICINDNEIYSKDNESPDRWCYLGQQTTSALTVTLPEGCTIEGFHLPEKTQEQRLCAYLPVTSYSAEMLNSGILESLDAVTLNVGCYWQADGTLDVKPALTEAIEQIHSAYPELELWCTINPKNAAAGAIYTAEQRALLIRNIEQFCEEQGLDGVDIDWEFPAENEWEAFSAFIVELRESGLKLSLAFYPEDIKLSDEAVKTVSAVNVMAYDQFDEAGRHSTYETTAESIEYFLNLGFAPEQLCLGIPAYGRPLDGSAQWPLYCDYASQLADGTDLLGDAYFNSPQLAQDKCALAKGEALGGVFLYHLGCDDGSLTQAAAEVLQ